MKSKKVIFSTLALILLFVFNFTAVSAAEFKFVTEDKNITVDAGEVVKNLYTAGNIISINGEVQKDLYAAGNVITVGNNVEDNVCAFGGTVIIKGDVGGNVHSAAGSIIVEGNIAEDLFVVGGSILISKSATIGGDLVIGGGTVEIEGPVVGKVLIGGGDVTINSKIGGLVKITADKVNIGEFAEIEKDMKYTSPREAKIHDDAKILGKIDFDKRAVKDADKSYAAKVLFSILSAFFLLKLVTYIAVGLVLVHFLKRMMKAIVMESLANPWGSLGRGLAALFLTPIVGIILAISVIGLYLAGLLTIIYVLLIMVSSIMANIVFGSWFLKIFKKKKEYRVGWQEVVVGVVVLQIVWFVPVVGWLICLGFVLISLGALSRLIRKEVIRSRNG